MLALVHPAPSPDVHRPPPSSSRPHRRHTLSRAHSTSSSASSSASSSTSSSSRLPYPPPLSRRVPSPPPPPPPEPPSLDIHNYPSTELLRLLASLLTQIASTNDALKESSKTSAPSHTHFPSDLTTASLNALSNPASTLTFHARNVPTITLEAYLLRILKYCPTTNEVFLALLVYFDRMSKLTGRAFVIDSYNIHRLVIAGVTVASKFFSDVFYTNSRYAKVGGLPLAELNQLELQFLLLNDFRLVIPREEMQRYAEQLLLFSNTGSLDSEDDAETEGGWTSTDDEPTIRPPRSEDSCSIASEDSFSAPVSANDTDQSWRPEERTP